MPLRTALALLLALALPAHAFETEARAAYVRDLGTGTVLMAKNADEPLPPASMSKLMTLYMLFEAVDSGRVRMEDTFGVSARATAMGGSSMFLTERDRPTVEDLIRGIVVQSGNDATVVVAEGLGGTEDAFARQMTERARDLGMRTATFTNSSGWPDPDQLMSTRDLGILAERLIVDFPDYYPYFAEETFPYDGRVPGNHGNRNPLLGLGIGADGLKTGHTQEAGYGLTGSAKQGDRRLIFVITGLESSAARADESERIVNWGFRQFVMQDAVRAGARLAEADVWLGAAPTVGLTTAQDLSMLVSAIAAGETSAEIVYDGPLVAPLAAGTEVGELIVTRADLPEMRVPVVTQEAVPAAGIAGRMGVAARRLAGEVMGGATGAADGVADGAADGAATEPAGS